MNIFKVLWSLVASIGITGSWSITLQCAAWNVLNDEGPITRRYRDTQTHGSFVEHKVIDNTFKVGWDCDSSVINSLQGCSLCRETAIGLCLTAWGSII